MQAENALTRFVNALSYEEYLVDTLREVLLDLDPLYAQSDEERERQRGVRYYIKYWSEARHRWELTIHTKRNGYADIDAAYADQHKIATTSSHTYIVVSNRDAQPPPPDNN